MSILDTQKLYEKMYDRNQEKQLLITEIESLNLEITEYQVKILAMVLGNQRLPISVLLGMSDNPDNTVTEVMDLIERDYLDGLPTSNNLILISKWELDFDTKKLLEQYRYLNPMLVEPNIVTSNRDKTHITLGKESMILKNNHHEDEISLDVLNILNQTKLSLEPRVILNIRDSRNNLDKPKQGESRDDYKKRIEDFKEFEKESMLVMASMINNGNEFYLTHKFDKRGRIYSQGYHINYQGNCYRKAVIQLSKKERILCC